MHVRGIRCQDCRRTSLSGDVARSCCVGVASRCDGVTRPQCPAVRAAVTIVMCPTLRRPAPSAAFWPAQARAGVLAHATSVDCHLQIVVASPQRGLDAMPATGPKHLTICVVADEIGTPRRKTRLALGVVANRRLSALERCVLGAVPRSVHATGGAPANSGGWPCGWGSDATG